METSNIKSYAPKARVAFMDAVAKRLNTFGISADKKGELQVIDALVQGSVLQIGDNNFDSKLAPARQRLVERSEQLGYAQLVEQVAYTWFNRLSAIRYMEIHGYLGHGFRVLSHPNGDKRFEILDHAQDAAEDLGLDRDRIIDLMLAGDKNEELYRELLLGQCHKLHEAMPFLFEALNDETELLLPDNLTRTDSILRGLVDSIPEEDWQQVEVIGWLYQSYISEKKDQVIGKVVKTEDIPAATQLFTPNWIVKYMVQNSLGAQWLATYPKSPLKAQMEYYIEPAEQTDEVNAQLKAITPESLNPEELTLIDPASGSGHILVEAYDLFKAIYLERGYRQRDIAQLILENNLFGLDIDQRAAQLTGFALMMKGREDDRRLFERGVKMNVMAMHNSSSLDPNTLAQGINLASYQLNADDLTEFIELFEHAHDFGSLIQIPPHLADKLPAFNNLVQNETHNADLFVSEALQQLTPLVVQANILAAQYDAVVANPPYMGSKGMNTVVKKFAKDNFPNAKSDLFACFIERGYSLTKDVGRGSIVAPYVWMFISSYENFRENFFNKTTLVSLIQLEYNAFEPACIPVATFSFSKISISSFKGSFIRLSDFKGHQNQAPRVLEAINNRNCGWLYINSQSEFGKIPGSTVAYWASEAVLNVFADGDSIQNYARFSCGMFTCNNERFIRYWWEVAKNDNRMFGSKNARWVPHVKGASGERWSKPTNYVVDFSLNGDNIRSYRKERGQSYSLPGEKYYFKAGVSFPLITSGTFSAVGLNGRSTFDISSNSAFPDGLSSNILLASLCSKPTSHFVSILCPTLNFTPGDIGKTPLLWDKLCKFTSKLEMIAEKCVLKTTSVINLYENSDKFQSLPLLSKFSESIQDLESSYNTWISQNQATIAEMKHLEEENNRLFIDAYGLQDELTPEVPIEQITLTVNPTYRYGIKGTEEERNARFRSDTMTELVSYTIGCMMGRYSLDQEGLVYAHAGNEGFDASLYQTFPADSDGIIPITEEEWFKDDVSNRVVECVKTVWGEDNLTENLQFIADSLCLDAITPRKSETAVGTIRRYLSTKFYKDHMQTYKKRPIYWLFSSGKEKAFECLVYLHRYNESTLSRMRTEYVTPLLGKYQAYAEQLDKQLEMAESTQDKKRLEKELKSMDKKQSELREFDDKLKHYADMRISIDLDDGVKENYGKFGDLLADVKNITGEKPEIINAN
ncbi:MULTISPECIES: BREX-1 system adenine-specific DNA-methyltransferase PglX [unclassified Psychrobacter]|uniref:BREX-1 system adenine-specific DNA-methyltransferase PglX n=1 Tax=unclassified Psychrobacter TaxID=196806 RepID=UPI0025EC0824|nr:MULTISPECIES: BREX-1 system adenine-specific DNA-methyltransferase PglX [unclassified Psychrobacter]